MKPGKLMQGSIKVFMAAIVLLLTIVGEALPSENFILSGGFSTTTNIGVDDDMTVYLNGTVIYIDENHLASSIPPISFTTSSGNNVLRVTAVDSYGGCHGLSPLYLHRLSNGSVTVLDSVGVVGVCDYAPASQIPFYDKTFTFTINIPIPPSDLGEPPDLTPPTDPYSKIKEQIKTWKEKNPNRLNIRNTKSACLGVRGAPGWKVNPVNMNLYVADTPLWYEPPIGPPVEISLSYNSKGTDVYQSSAGNKWRFNFDSRIIPSGDSATVYMPDGRQDTYINQRCSESDHLGSCLKYAYTSPTNIYNTLTFNRDGIDTFELKFPDGTVYFYLPDANRALLKEISDPYGQKLIFNYDANDHITSITDALGKVTILTYNESGLMTQATDPFGRSALFEYDANRNLTKITDMGGYWASLSYETTGGSYYLSGIENARGRWSFFTEPSGTGAMGNSHRITVTNPEGGKEEYYYNALGGSSWHVASRDYVAYVDSSTNNAASSVPKTVYNLVTTNSRGEVSKITYPEGGYVEYGYDLNGNKTSFKDSHGHTTAYTYNGLGQVTSITDPKGSVTNYTYDAFNDVDLLQVQNGLGTTTMTYNGTHDVTSVTDLLVKTTNLAYNSYGQAASITDPLGVVTNNTYDANHNVQTVTKDGNVLNTYTYDAVGRVKTSADATGMTRTYTYDNLDRVSSVSYPDGKQETYAYSSCCPWLLDSYTDRGGRTTSYVYDSLKRLIQTTNPDGTSIKYQYDANGNMIKLTDTNGNATKFEYNKDNRLTKKSYANGKSVLFVYDGAGLLTQRTDARGITTTYTYDQNHNLLSISYSDGTPGVTYTYDNYNRITQRTDGIGTYAYSYDADSRLTSIDGPWASDAITYQYDDLGRLTGMTPEGGQAVAYTLDALNRTTGVQPGTNAFSYSYSGSNPLVNSLTRPNGSITNYQYDSMNRLIDVSNKDSAAAMINRFEYTYNAQDFRASETITNGDLITSFQNELITYDYDSANELLNSTNPAKTFVYDYDGNLIQGYTPEGFEFAATYDAENRLKSLTYTDSIMVVNKTEYYYSGDSFLAQVKKYEDTNLAGDRRYVRDGFLSVQERDADNNVTAQYTWGLNMGGGIGGLLTIRKGGQDYSYLYDGKGNVTAVLDSSQSVVATYTYDTFGNLMSKTGTLDQPYQFSTKAYDEKTGLLYYGYRFYCPSTGRWITKDPLGEAGGLNLYGFVGENPVTQVDPLGLSGCAISNNNDAVDDTWKDFWDAAKPRNIWLKGPVKYTGDLIDEWGKAWDKSKINE